MQFIFKGTYPLTRYVKSSLEGSAPPTPAPSTQPTPAPTGGATNSPTTTNGGSGGLQCPQPNGLFAHPDSCEIF